MVFGFARAFALATLSVSALSHACGDELLVLRNGYVIDGEVTQVGDRYIVRAAKGSEVRIPVAAVEFRCRDLEDAFRRKAGQIRRGQVNGHIQLFEWCLRHELIGHAEEQLVICERLDPLNPQVHQMRRRFQSVSAGSAIPAVVSVSHHRPKAHELNLMMRGLPADTVEQFTTTIQPLLLNRCSNGACHGPHSEPAFRLTRPRPGRELERPFTQRNLHATLVTIDRNRPLDSPLVKVLTKPHGPNGSIDPGLSKDQVERVVKWIKGLSNNSAANRPDSIATDTRTLRQAPRKTKWRSDPVRTKPLPKPKPADGSDNPSASLDPFDPEVFNRRYHTKVEMPGAAGRKQAAPQRAADENVPARGVRK